MTIDPKWAFIFNIIALVLSVLVSASWWGDLLGNKQAATVTGIMGTIASAINVVLAAYSSPKKGPMA